MKYSIAPLKQTNETIMVFQKPYKTGSCMHDVLAMENGDSEITCGALDIDGNRVGTETITNNGGNKNGKNTEILKGKDWQETTHKGRFPSQTFVNDEAAKHLDLQSGIDNRKDQRPFKKAGRVNLSDSIYKLGMKTNDSVNYTDTGGCSKILHKCNYELERFDIYTYCPKVSNEERGNFNDHPTVKPLKLLQRILKYFKTPNKQIVLDSFVGSGSIPIAAINEGYDYIGTELNADYYEIAQKRIFEAQRQTKLF